MINVKYYEQRAAYDADKPNLILPNVSYCEDTDEVFYNPKPEPHDYSQDYLTFVAEEDGTFKFSLKDIQYSTNSGVTWINLTKNENTPTVTAGNTIMFKAELTPSYQYGVGSFSSTGRFTAQGNVMSLLYGDGFKDQKDLTGKHYAFLSLFSYCKKLTAVKHLSLPATTLSSYSYGFMFRGCTSITESPILPATTLESYCYNQMFAGCTSLNKITCLATDISKQTCTTGWVDNVAPSGTFYKNPNMTSWTTGNDGIPTGWIIINNGNNL